MGSNKIERKVLLSLPIKCQTFLSPVNIFFNFLLFLPCWVMFGTHLFHPPHQNHEPKTCSMTMGTGLGAHTPLYHIREGVGKCGQNSSHKKKTLCFLLKIHFFLRFFFSFPCAAYHGTSLSLSLSLDRSRLVRPAANRRRRRGEGIIVCGGELRIFLPPDHSTAFPPPRKKRESLTPSPFVFLFLRRRRRRIHPLPLPPPPPPPLARSSHFSSSFLRPFAK